MGGIEGSRSLLDSFFDIRDCRVGDSKNQMTETVIELPGWLAPLLERTVAVFGGGASGMAARDLLLVLGAEVDVYDERAGEGHLCSFGVNEANQHDLVVYSPGFPFDHEWLAVARDMGMRLMPEVDLGAALWNGPIIAITGTNGKTTLTEFLEKAFGSVGLEAYACGNIGRPLSRLLADGINSEAIAVCEVSSFQASGSSCLQADYVLWTNFDVDHLDRHGSLEQYFNSKYKLVDLMRGDSFFYGESVLAHARFFGVELPDKGLVEEGAEGIYGTVFENLPERKNYFIARSLWLSMGLSEEGLVEAAHTFRKSPHRMELIRSAGGISFWDDSKATNFHATFGGLSRFTKPAIWIGGGKDKGCDIGGFSNRLAPQLSSAHLIGETAQHLCAALTEQGCKVRVYDSLEEAVIGARSLAESGDNVLLSPGFASLDMFDSYSQRGEAFKKAVNSLETL